MATGLDLAYQLKLEVPRHEVRRQRGKNGEVLFVFPISPLYSDWGLSLWDGATHAKVGLTFSVKPV